MDPGEHVGQTDRQDQPAIADSIQSETRWSGVLLDRDTEQAVADAEVVILAQETEWFRGCSDERGRFSFVGPATGGGDNTVRVMVRHPDYLPVDQPIALTARGARIRLRLDRPVVLPELTGLRLGEGRKILEELGLTLGQIIARSDGASALSGRILSTNPPAGTLIARSDPVNVVWAQGAHAGEGRRPWSRWLTYALAAGGLVVVGLLFVLWPRPQLIDTIDLSGRAKSASTEQPSAEPAAAPTRAPVAALTEAQTIVPSATPTITPSETPSVAPSEAPTVAPTQEPTAVPTQAPIVSPTSVPIVSPAPTALPTARPSSRPTRVPEVRIEFPDLIGESEAHARALLTRLGLTSIAVQTRGASASRPNSVLATDPGPGERVARDTRVTLIVAGQKD